MSNRVVWIEQLRGIAILMIVVTHFIAGFCPDLFRLWDDYSLLLSGITGKFGVAIFCAILGYFAAKETEANILTYSLRRYLQFAVNILLVVLLYAGMLFVLRVDAVAMPTMGQIAGEAFLFKSNIVPTYWCVADLFWGSIVCYALGNYLKRLPVYYLLGIEIVLCVLLFFTHKVWLMICVMGGLYRLLWSLHEQLDKKWQWLICALFLPLIPCLYRHPESEVVYMMQGIAACLIMYVAGMLTTLPMFKPEYQIRGLLYWIGRLSFYVFLLHTPVNVILHSMNPECSMWGVFALSFGLTMFVSVLLYLFNQYLLSKWLRKLRIWM